MDAHQVPVIERSYDVVIAGAGAAGICAAAELLGAGITDFAILESSHEINEPLRRDLGDRVRLGREVISSVFDDGTDAWRLTARGGETCHSRVVIATYDWIHVPWIPNLSGRNDFRGISFHGTAPDPDFDAADKHIAVIGSDAAAGRLIGRLTASAASIKVFPLPPRRVIPQVRPPSARAKRWLRRRASAEPVNSPIDTVTASGIRTRDGAHHECDAIVYGTGFEIRAGLPHDTLVGAGGLTIQQAWHDGMEPYLGVALHGFPNYFMLRGPEFEAAVRYVVECLQLVNGYTRIEVRRSTEQVFNERVHLRPPSHRRLASAFDLSSSTRVHDDTYDGAATLTLADTCRQVRVRLAGHIDPIDGQYHWQGTIFDHLPADLLARARWVNLAVGERSASARITEQTPQGTHSIAGVGAPPFALADVEFTVPQL
jgi:cation diffusion facilitator CzcD-associated flavoprotein CzcO